MSPRQNFFSYIVITGVTIVGLFGLQHWFATALDVRWNEELKERPANPEIAALRNKERQQLEASGLEAAMVAVAKSRMGHPPIAPTPSQDLSAMSGWVHQPNFVPYEPQPVRLPAIDVAPSETDPSQRDDDGEADG